MPSDIFDFLIEHQVVDTNPIKPSHVLKRARTLPRALAKEQLEQLFAQIHHPVDRALFLLMLRSGLRVSEVAQLKVRDLDWPQQALLIEQGKAARIAGCISQRMPWRACTRVCSNVPVMCPVTWFSGIRSGPAVRYRSRPSKRSSGMQSRRITASCHSLRHTFASNLLEQGAEIVSIRELLGHASISSSERYAKLSNQHVKQEYLRTMKRVLQRSKV